MDKLAIDGGNKTFEVAPTLKAWPPVYDDTEKLLVKIYRSGKWSFNGPYERLFDEKFAAYHTAKYGVFMANGTVTLEAALAALGVGPGDEVIVPGYTWIATGMAPLYVGATPVIVDIEPDTLCMDPAAFEAAITPRTKAVIPVHLYGSMADLEKICSIAKKHHIAVIEDCAHAHGGVWNGRGVGSIGDVGSFSFQESKTMPSGEGGSCTTSNEFLFERLDRFKHIGYPRDVKQGQPATPAASDLLCHNYRATEFQAAILLGMLEHLKQDTQERADNAEYIRARINQLPGIQVQAKGRLADVQSYYVFAMLLDPAMLKPGIDSQTVINAMQAEGIGVGKGWSGGAPIHQQFLWNIPASKYRIDSISVASDYCQNRLIAMSLQWLMMDRQNTEKLCDGIEKVMHAYTR